ncbi:site-2 protease family protein [Desulfovibrio inopinatus]|uniref:site-2 protease family protein n=1 Tax=Desulfovibrio inopinatus TaxID=102109 RepID=UPI00041006C4|nr:site-2 protease family protein [Desulfovibrio inopinatus]
MSNIAHTIQLITLMAVPMLLAVVCHEVAHGYVAYLLGDPTAKNAGRLTLNPIKHLDFLGTLTFIVTQMIGWAKPVPVDSRYFKDQRKGVILVSLAGPMTNLFLAFLFTILSRLIPHFITIIPPEWQQTIFVPVFEMAKLGIQINLILCLFNLIPIPPLDGSQILAALLPPHAAYQFMQFGRYGFLIILALAIFGLLGRILLPGVQFLYMTMLAATSWIS